MESRSGNVVAEPDQSDIGVSIRVSEGSFVGGNGCWSKGFARVSVGSMALAGGEEETAGCHARTCAGEVADGVVVVVAANVIAVVVEHEDDAWDLVARCLPVLWDGL